MGCNGSKTDDTLSKYENDISVEDKIFSLLKENFCASGPEASLFGSILKEDAILKITNKLKKLQETKELLEHQSASDYFIQKLALVDPIQGEIIITYDRVMDMCNRFDIDELHMLYDRLRSVKVERLRNTHGSDIISIIDPDGDAQYSACGGRGRHLENRYANANHNNRPAVHEDTGQSSSACGGRGRQHENNNNRPAAHEDTGQNVFDIRNVVYPG